MIRGPGRPCKTEWMPVIETTQKLLSLLVDPLIGPKCTSEIVDSFKLYPLTTKDPSCTLLALRKGLSLGIICGSALVKLPQILKVLLNQSARGLSMLSQLLELLASSVAFAYNFRAGNPFMVYGETVFVSIQNALLVLLVGFYGKKTMALLLLTAFYSIFLSVLLVPSYVSDDQMALLQGVTIPVSALARLPQIYQVWSTGSAGQLSTLSLFLTSAGSLARFFTALAEIKDSLLLIGYASTALLNSILFLQVLFFSQSKSKKKNKNKKKKD